MNQNRNEWVMHVWGKKRDVLELTDVEKFHIDLLKRYEEQQKRFDKILINIAMDDVKDKKLFNFLKREIKKSIFNENVEFKSCQNEKIKGEYVTFRPYVFDRIGEDVNIFYTHFKGYKSFLSVNRESYPMRVSDICEMFWSFMMYEYSLNFDDVQEKLKDNCVYSWFIWRRNKIIEDYFYTYHKGLCSGDNKFKVYKTDNLCKHSPGSFNWYNMKMIGESLEDKPEIKNVSTDYLLENSTPTLYLCTHFCEVYLMQYLKEDECYSVNDFNEEWMKIKNTAYTVLYPLKTIGRDLLGEFEAYLIEKEYI